MKILLTGGFGFIGSNLLRRLMLEDYDISVIDDLSSGEEIISKDIVFYNLTVQDNKCEKIFADNNFDIVIHLAYKGYNEEYFNADIKDLHDNNVGLSNILYLSKKYNVKKVIVLSSFRVYGEKHDKAFIEIDSTNSSTPEGRSYISREALVKEYEALGLNTLILRLGAVYGQYVYGSDISFIISNKDNTGDYIYIDDLCKVLIKAIESQTESILNISNGEGNSNIIDSSKVRYLLNWYPEYSFKEEFINERRDSSIDYDVEVHKLKKSKKHIILSRINKLRDILKNKDTEVLILFIITFYLNNLIRHKLGLNLDLFVLYIVFIGLIYGLKQGLTAVLLSCISFVWSYFNYEHKTALMLINDIGSILYLTIYFVLGTSTGYLVNEQKRNRLDLIEEVKLVNEEIDFIKQLYEKSQIVKNNLQYIIENYKNNLTRTNKMIEQLISTTSESIYDDILDIYAKNFHSDSVSIYTPKVNNKILSLMSSKGNKNFNETYKINDFEFLSSLLIDRKIFINKKLIDNYPTFAIPIFYGESIMCVVFLEDISFNYMNQSFLNDLKVTTNIISKIIYKILKIETMGDINDVEKKA